MGYTASKSLRQVLDQSLAGCTKVMGDQMTEPMCGGVLDLPQFWSLGLKPKTQHLTQSEGGPVFPRRENSRFIFT